MPSKLAFGKSMTVNVTVPEGLDTSDVKRKRGFDFCRCSYRSPFLFFILGFVVSVALMDLGFSTHAFHSSARLVFMNATLSDDKTQLTFTTPPSGRVYPPGPATIFLTVDDITSPVRCSSFIILYQS